nr:MAG TPA: hypothetical protein [Caudoviricetes sp.]
MREHLGLSRLQKSICRSSSRRESERGRDIYY